MMADTQGNGLNVLVFMAYNEGSPVITYFGLMQSALTLFPLLCPIIPYYARPYPIL